jgi:type IV secretion system protein VirD4
MASVTGVSGRVAAFGLLLPLVGWLLSTAPAYVPGRGFWPLLIVTGPVLLAGVVVVLWHRRAGSAGVVGRWSRRSRRNSGVASTWAVLRTASWLAMRRKAKILRPSLRGLHWWQRLAVPTRAYATPLARVGWLRVWSACEDVTLRAGGPRTGKTGELAGRILDAPGAVIATSTRMDLVELTGPRRKRSGPVFVFNPAGVGDLPSTITFDPLSGCCDPATAKFRAADLIAGVSAPGRDGGDREFWAGQARRVLASLLHAAALGDTGMRDVLGWVADPDTAAADIRRFLRRSVEPAFEADATQFLATNERTRSSICSTVMPALGWLTDATAAQAAGANTDPDAAGSDAGFDVAALLDSSGTVFMLGAEDGQTAPLLCALTGHIARQARTIAARQPGGRLDPPLTVVLDEAALVSPVPLDNWTADMGGRGVTIHIGVQSRAQLRQRWSEDGAAAILNNTATLLIYGGTRDPEDLAAYSTLTGERDEQVASYDPAGNLTGISHRRVPVLSPAQIAQLPARRVVIIRRGMPAAVGTVRMAWRRRDVRRTNQALTWAPRIHRLRATAAQLAAWGNARTRQATAWAAPHLTRIGHSLTGRRPLTGPVRSGQEEGTSDAV